jgi:hypothetical protein
MATYEAAAVEIVEVIDDNAAQHSTRYGVFPKRVRVNGTDVGLLRTAPVVSTGDGEPDETGAVKAGIVTVTLVLVASSVTIKAEQAPGDGDDGEAGTADDGGPTPPGPTSGPVVHVHNYGGTARGLTEEVARAMRNGDRLAQ